MVARPPGNTTSAAARSRGGASAFTARDYRENTENVTGTLPRLQLLAMKREETAHPPPAFRLLVRVSWLVSSPAPARHGRKRPREPSRPPDRTHRRRQDPGRLPAEPDRDLGAAAGEQSARDTHPVHIAVEGVGGRCRAQPDGADPADGSEGHRRVANGRHGCRATAAAADQAAGHPADHARTARPFLRLGRSAAVFRGPSLHRPRRDSRRLAIEAR